MHGTVCSVSRETCGAAALRLRQQGVARAATHQDSMIGSGNVPTQEEGGAAAGLGVAKHLALTLTPRDRIYVRCHKKVPCVCVSGMERSATHRSVVREHTNAASLGAKPIEVGDMMPEHRTTTQGSGWFLERSTAYFSRLHSGSQMSRSRRRGFGLVSGCEAIPQHRMGRRNCRIDTISCHFVGLSSCSPAAFPVARDASRDWLRI